MRRTGGANHQVCSRRGEAYDGVNDHRPSPNRSASDMKARHVALLLGLHVTAVANAYDPLEIARDAPASGPQDFIVQDAERKRDIPIRVYLPQQKSAAPVVLFSHGLGGTREGSAFLGRHWSARGYAVVFLQHPGSDDSVWKGKPLAERASAMRQAGGLQSFQFRVKDVPAVIDQLERWNKEMAHPLASRLNLARLGMSGHSFGAITTQAVSGQTFPLVGASFTDPRIKAAVVFSPSRPAAGDANKAFAGVKIPWLLMTGTKDIARLGGETIGAADMEARLAVYPALPPGGKYELVLDGAEHSVFTDRALPGESGQRNPQHHPAILALSTAFWDVYLQNGAEARAWLGGNGPRTVLEEKDTWQRK